jgi:DNA-binding LytR/AlgR family response regulator
VRHIVGLDRSSDGHYQIRLKDVDESLDISRRHVAGVRKFVKTL